MADELKNLLVRVGADVTDFTTKMGSVSAVLEEQSAQWLKSGAILTGAVSLPLGALAGASIIAAGNIEQVQIAFTTMLGSAEKAGVFLKELKDFAATTPFEFPELVDASKRLMALGFSAEQVIPTMRTVGDAVSALGGGAELINRVTLALGQMQAKGKVSAEEMRQLAEAGIPAWEILAKAIGTSIPEAMKLAEKGAISAAAALPAILGGMNERFAGLMEQQSKTLLGQWSNLKDKLTYTLMDIGAALLPIAKMALDAFTPLLGKIQELAKAFGELPPWVQQGIIAVAALVAAFGPVLTAIGGIGLGISALAPLFTAMAATAGTVSFAVGTGLVGALGAAEMAILGLSGALGILAGALVGAKIGLWLADMEMAPGILRNVRDAILGVDSAAKDLVKSAFSDLDFATKKLEESLKKKGITVDKAGLSVEQYSQRLREAANQLTGAANSQDNATNSIKEAMDAQARAVEATKAYQAEVNRLTEAEKAYTLEQAKARTELFAISVETIKARDATEQYWASLDKTADQLRAVVLELPPLGDAMEDALELSSGSWEDLGLAIKLSDLAMQESLKTAQVTTGEMAVATAKSTEKQKSAWSDLGRQVSTIFTDMSRGIADALWSGDKSLKGVFLSVFEEMGKAVTRFVIEYLQGKLFKALAGLVDDILPGVGKKLGDIFGSTGSTPKVPGTSTPSIPDAGGAGGAVGSALGAVTGVVGAVGSVAGAVGGIYYGRKMEDTLNAIELNTRQSDVMLWQGVGSVLGRLTTFLPLISEHTGFLGAIEQRVLWIYEEINALRWMVHDSIVPAFEGGRASSITINVEGVSDPNTVANIVMQQLRLEMVPA